MIGTSASRKLKRVLAFAALAIALVTTANADAYWSSSGSGSGSGSAGTLDAPTLNGSPGAGTVSLSWSPVSPPGVGAVTYYVTRNGGFPSGNCPPSSAPTSVLACTDSGLAAGTYSYTVTAVWRTWTATSSPVTQVEVVNLPPVNTALPAITGTATQGQVLSTSNGSWTNSPTGYSYQWRRCDSAGSNCVDISGATSSTYVIQSGDVGSTIKVVVTAANPYGSTAATSAMYPSSGTVQPRVPVNVDPPTILGAAEAGQTLTADNGTWTNSPTGYAYQWLRCDSTGSNCSNISGDTPTVSWLSHRHHKSQRRTFPSKPSAGSCFVHPKPPEPT